MVPRGHPTLGAGEVFAGFDADANDLADADEGGDAGFQAGLQSGVLLLIGGGGAFDAGRGVQIWRRS